MDDASSSTSTAATSQPETEAEIFEATDETTVDILSDAKKQARHLCFTWWICDETITEWPQHIYAGLYSYIVFQMEKCPTTGRYHFQGYMQFEKNQHLATVYKKNPIRKDPDGNLLSGAWLRVCRGSSDQNVAYCTKEDTRVSPEYMWEFGERRNIAAAAKSRVRNPTDRMISEVLDGVFDPTLRVNQIEMIKHKQHYENAKRLHAELTRSHLVFEETRVFVHWGASRSGKSHNAQHACYRYNPQTKSCEIIDYCNEEVEGPTYEVPAPRADGTPWFDGYDGEHRIWFDEVTPGKFGIAEILKICDLRSQQVQVKGGFTLRNWSEIHFTSNIHPCKWFPQATEEQLKAFYLRIRRNGGMIFHYQTIHPSQSSEENESLESVLASISAEV